MATPNTSNRVSKSAQQRLANELRSAQEDALQKSLAVAPEPFGLAGLTARNSLLAERIGRVLEEDVRKLVLAFFQNNQQSPEKFNPFWKMFLPKEMTPAEQKAVQIAMSPQYWWGNFIRLPEIKQALAEDAALGLVTKLQGTAGFLANEARLLEEWKQQRPHLYNYAKQNTQDVLNRFYTNDLKDPECKVGLEAAGLLRMAAYRMLDAHFTGDQTYEPSDELGGLPYIHRRLRMAFLAELPAEVAAEIERRYGLIKIGIVKSATYGLPNRVKEQTVLEKAFNETNPKSVYDAGKKFNYNHCVTQLTGMLCPLMSLFPERIQQKSLHSVKFLYGLYSIAKEVADFERHSKIPLSLDGVVIDPKALPHDVVPRFDPQWMASRFISPAMLHFAGFKPNVHRRMEEAARKIMQCLPEFANQLRSSEVQEKLALQRTWSVVIKPIFAQAVQREFISVYKHMYPQDFEYQAKKVADKHATLRLTNPAQAEVAERSDMFEHAMETLLRNQGETLRFLDKRYNVEAPEDVVFCVHAERPLSWIGLKGGEQNGEHPALVKELPSSYKPSMKEWFLLEKHLQDLRSSGLNDYTIARAGIFSVTNPAFRERILTRGGKENVQPYMTSAGKLLCFPNPLFYPDEIHSKTELSKPKYLAPANGCNPPLVIPSQAQFTSYNRSYLVSLNGEENVQKMEKALAELHQFEKEHNLLRLRAVLERRGFDGARAKSLAEAIYSKSALSRMATAIDDPEADIEITEGQKKIYCMAQSYEELLQKEADTLIGQMDPKMSEAQAMAVLEGHKFLPPRVFVCSPGVWLPAKKMGDDRINPNNPYMLIPSWKNTINMDGRKIIITYDADADKNINVAHSVTAMGAAIKDVFPKAGIYYRMIDRVPSMGQEDALPKGADDFIVALGGEVFWKDLKVFEISTGVSYKELASKVQPGQSFIRYLVKTKEEQNLLLGLQ
jgi:hypothetical protein